MFRQELRQKIIISFFIFGLFLPFSFVSAGTILSTNNYAWSNNVGWINFAPVNAGVIVNDSILSGYAWSENSGYINFAPTNGGVFNDGNGDLSGSAWGEGLGYIDFDGVSINPINGKFSGTATGDIIGTLTFDCIFCDVRTEWRPYLSNNRTSGSVPKFNLTKNNIISSILNTGLSIGLNTSPKNILPKSSNDGLVSSLQASVGTISSGIVSKYDFQSISKSVMSFLTIPNVASIIFLLLILIIMVRWITL